MTDAEIEALANKIHDVDLRTRWAIIEGAMRLSLIQMHANRQVVTGTVEGGTAPIWMMLATEEPDLIARIQKVIDDFDGPKGREFIEERAELERGKL